MATRRLVVLGLAILIVAGIAAGCQSQPQATNPEPPPPATEGGGISTQATGNAGEGANKQAVSVTIANFEFDPQSVTVKAGATVTWKNEDSAPHQVYSDDGQIKSPDIGQGETFSYTFKKAGAFPYHCNLHRQMTGTVVVE